MRIAFVVLGALSTASGGFVYDRMVIDRLRRRGHVVDVVELPAGSYAGQLAQNARCRGPARRLSAYDVVIEDELAHAALCARAAGATRAPPRVALVHNLSFRQPRTRARALVALAERAYLRGVDAAVCVCRDSLGDVQRFLAHGAPSALSYAGSDHAGPALAAPAAELRAHEPGPLRALLLGAVLPHKGLHRALEIAARAGSAVELHVVGAWPSRGYATRTRARMARPDLAGRVHVHGFLDGDALRARVRACQVLLLPSDREAYPLAVVEALGHGLAVLATERGGTGEVLSGAVGSRLLDPDDLASWCAALSELAHDRAALARAGTAALARHAELASWDDTAVAIERVLERVVSRA